MSEVKRYEMKTTYRGHESWDSLEEDKDGGYVNYEDYAALESKCAALAAERTRLKSAVTQQIELRAEIKKAGRPPHADFWVQSICEAEENVKRAIEEAPATDAFLDEVRAQGGAKALEDFAEFNIKSIDPFDDEYTEVLKEVARAARCFAAQLRKGGEKK